MRFLIVFLLSCGSTGLFAQTSYYDFFLKKIRKSDAQYYSKEERKGRTVFVRLYNVKNDLLVAEGGCASTKPGLVWQGKHVTFHKNGKVESEGQYTNGNKIGTWLYYHDNGVRSGEDTFDGDEHRYIQRWDENGNTLLNEGTGVYPVKFDGTISYREVLHHKLRSSFSINDTGDTTYTVVEKTAEYPGGMEGFYQYIGRTMKYPVEAKRNGIQGRVFVQFVIQKDGTVSEVKTIKGIGGGCDEEAANVTKASVKWKPGTLGDRPVRQVMVLPMVFKLG